METLLILAAPASNCLLLCLAWWLSLKPSERVISGLLVGSFLFSGLSAATVFWMQGAGTVHSETRVWLQLEPYRLSWVASLDPLSLLVVMLACGLVCIVGIFSESYLHQERGFLRFYLLTAIFGLGVELVALAGSLDQVFFGWELVGVSSALLIAFFSQRTGPARNGLRAFMTYRICDIGLLSAVVWMHHQVGTSAISETGGPWYGLKAPASSTDATIVLLLLLFACMGKSALAPFGGWLPRAMEGPTPSSAVFYGALSIHLGPYLLLRCWPLLKAAPLGAAAVVLVGLLTSLHGTLVGRVQSDAKSALAYGSMTQVGLMLVEIGLGFHLLAVLHMVGHATWRTLEILRAPSLLHDYHHLEISLNQVLPRMGLHYELLLPRRLRTWLYRNALERGFFESWVFFALQGWQSMVAFLDRGDRVLESLLRGAQR